MAVKNSENVNNSDIVDSSSVVHSSSDVYSSRYVHSSSDVYSSSDVKRCENILFCYDVRLKEFYAFNKQVTESRFYELKNLNNQIFDGVKLKLTEWIKEEDMTDKEKKENSDFPITKGYLKLREYKEAWTLRWLELPKEKKDQLLAIPEFDGEVFKNITGIDVRKTEDDEEVAKAIALLESKGKIKEGKIIL